MFELNIIDDLTFQFIFSQPYGDFLYEIADRDNLHPTFYQKAYCSRAHPDYNENLAADLAENNLTDWRDYLLQLCGNPGKSPTRWGNPDRPSLEAWVVVEPYTGGATQVVLERNPYFWQVDEEGRQLPYIDRLIGTVYADPEGLLLGAVAGNVDYGQRKLEAAANRPALAEAAPRIGAKLYDVTAIGGSSCWFQLNLTHKDPDLNWLFNEEDFRIALSIGFDRQEVIDTALLGEGIPWNNGPFEDSPMYHEQYATQYLEFDPDRANELLDGIGLTERNSDGIRLMPNGRPVRFTAEITVARNDIVDQLEIMSAHWRDNIGVEMRINATERALMYAKVDNNDHDATAWDDNASWGPRAFPVIAGAGRIQLALGDRLCAVVQVRWNPGHGTSRPHQGAFHPVRAGEDITQFRGAPVVRSADGRHCRGEIRDVRCLEDDVEPGNREDGTAQRKELESVDFAVPRPHCNGHGHSGGIRLTATDRRTDTPRQAIAGGAPAPPAIHSGTRTSRSPT